MPIYEYQHVGKACRLGKVFEREQSITDKPLSVCPGCKKKVKRLISAPSLSFRKTDGEWKDMGFTKLVKRDAGVYENVTAGDGDSKVVEIGNQSTYPDIKSKIHD